MPDETVRVFIGNVAKQGKAWKIDASDERGAVRTYTMHENDRDTGQPNTPPNVGEDVILVYATQVKEFQGKQETTYWVNEVRMPSNPRNGAEPPPPAQPEGTYEQTQETVAEPVQEIADRKKAPQTSSFENPINASIEWQVCLKEAGANARANLEWVSSDTLRKPIKSDDVVAEARTLFYGKEYPQHEEKAGYYEPDEVEAFTPQGGMATPMPSDAERALAEASEQA